MLPGFLARPVPLAVLLFSSFASTIRAGETPDPAPPAARADQLREEMREMIDAARSRVFPALVNIEVIAVSYQDGREIKNRGVGSGTIISPEGHVLTCQHVINKGRKFTCTMADKQEISATLTGEDPLTDLAVLKLDPETLKKRGGTLAVAAFGSSAKLGVGDYVMAMGSPFALSRSVTLGIVSNTERVFADSTGMLEPSDIEMEPGQTTGIFNQWIQHDALINPGNSGGPLVNLMGEVVGVNARGGASMGFAIPGDLARSISDVLIKQGEVSRSWLGLSLRTIKDSGFEKGVLVNSVVKGSPADEAGLRAGDLLLKIDGDDLAVRFAEQIPPVLKRLADVPIGSKVKLTAERDGKEVVTEATTRKLEKERGDERAFRAWGISGQQITAKMAREYRFESADGVFVSSVRAGGAAQLAKPAINGGEVIRKIDGEPISDLAALTERYKKLMQGEKPAKQILVEFDRGGESTLTMLEPKLEEEDERPRELAKAWIGVATQPVLKDLAAKLGPGGTAGYRITRVYPGTRAAEAGLKVGDVITSIEGESIVPRGMEDQGLLDRAIRRLDTDASATLKVTRNAEALEIKIPLEETRTRPDQAKRFTNRDFEMTVRDITFFDRDRRRWSDDIKGALVEQAEHAGWAGLAGVQPGDLVQRIGDREIANVAAFHEAIDAIVKDRPRRVVIVVLRGISTYYLFMEPEWGPAEDKSKSESTTKEKK